MAKIQILGQFESVTEDKILAVAEQISYESTTVASALDGKQDHLTFDNAPTSGSSNPVTSGGIYTGMSQMETSLKGYTDTTSAAAASDAIENALASNQILGSEDVATDSEFNEMVHEVFP